VRTETLPGKGNVVLRMLADVDADVLTMVDGDGTYDPAIAPSMVELVAVGGNDRVNVSRVPVHQDAYRRGHEFGNRFLTGSVRRLFARQVEDTLSGYKAMSRRFAKSFPVPDGDPDRRPRGPRRAVLHHGARRWPVSRRCRAAGPSAADGRHGAGGDADARSRAATSNHPTAPLRRVGGPSAAVR